MTLTIADYKVLSTLDETRGAVYYACMRENDTDRCVLKQLKSKRPSASDTAWFNQVYEKIRSLAINGLVKTWDVIRKDSSVYLAQEYFPGTALTSILETGGPFNIRVFLDVAVQLAGTLADLHGHDLSHLGIKPRHILINRETGQVKLSGFGIESLLTREYDEIFNPEVLAHHLPYLSPEQTGRMNRSVDYRADMYSLGASLYEMLVGVPPFYSDDALEIMHGHIARKPVSPSKRHPEIPRMVSDIILKLLSKNAEDRYQNALGLKADLETCLRQWDERGEIDDFELGLHDRPSRFMRPQVLYGREKDLGLLVSKFNRVIPESFREAATEGDMGFVWVTGHSGVGKTALIQEVQKTLISRRGYFIAGEYEQFQQDTPYSAINQAFGQLAGQILRDNDERVSFWKEAMCDALGSSGKIITDWIPTVEMIIGPQPEVIPLGSKQSRERAMDLVERFVDVFTSRNHPLTFFLDNMQWADRASLILLKALIARKNVGRVLIIGSYRDNEVDETHPLTGLINMAESHERTTAKIHLENLRLAEVKALVMDAFGGSGEKAEALASLVHDKTHGNPFFVGEFLEDLCNDKLICLDPQGGWTFDLEAIEALSVTDNVVAMLAGKIEQLPAPVRNILTTCACVGHRFSLELIARVQAVPLSTVLSDLIQAEERGFIVRADEGYAFVHNKVREAAYSLIGDDDKPAIHYTIGKLMHDSMDDEALNLNVFEVTDQLNLGKTLISSPSEKLQLSHLNLSCGKKAKSSMAYGPAASYLDSGLALLYEDCWSRQYNLTYHLYKESVETETMLGHFDKADRLMETALEKSRSLPDKAILYQIKIGACVAREDVNGALTAGYEFTGMAGIRSTGSQEEFDERYTRLMDILETKTDEDILALPQMTDPFQLAAMEVGAELGFVLYNLAPEILESGVLINIIKSFDYGVSPQLPYMITGLGLTIINRFNDIELAYRMGRLGLSMAERPYARKYKTRALFVFNTQIRHWKEHYKNTLDDLVEGYHLAIETGDHFYAANSLVVHDMHIIHVGMDYSDVEKTMNDHGRLIEKLHQQHIHSLHQVQRQFVWNMLGKNEDPFRLEGRMLNPGDIHQWEAANNRITLCEYWFLTLWVRVTLDRVDGIMDVLGKLSMYLSSMSGTGIFREHALLDVLARARVYGRDSCDSQAEHRAVIEKHLANLESWSGHCRENTLQLYHLARGEYARILGDTDQAVKHFETAIFFSKKHGFMNHELWATNCLFNLYLALGNKTLARAYLVDTMICARGLGAVAKIEQLKADHADLFDEMNPDRLPGNEPAARKAMGDSIDFKSVLKASQVISGEVALSGLLGHMMKIVMENAGATKVLTILYDKDELRVEAEMSQEKTGAGTLGAIPVKDHPGLSPAIVSYAARTKDVVILNNAVKEGDYTHDSYVREHKPQSILCYPIVNQSRLIGLLYLENALTTNAFTPQGVEVLGILASQIAISITNARLYASLEDKVRQRTEDLNRTLLAAEEANALITSSFEYASMMQASLLPSQSQLRKVLPDSFSIWTPRDIVGGDMYHLESIGDHVVLAVVDCTGHGVPGALMTMIAASGLRLIIGGEREIDPAMILKKLNRFAKASLKQDTGTAGTDDGMDAVVCSFSRKTGQLTFAGARLPLYVVDGEGVRVIKGDRQSLGYKSSKSDYQFTRHHVEPGPDTMIYLATDGYMDQLGIKTGKRFGSGRFKTTLAEIHTLSMDDKKQHLLEALAKHKGSRDNTDDVTLVGFRVS